MKDFGLICAILFISLIIWGLVENIISLKKENKTLKKQEKQNAKIDEQTQEQIEQITTGDIQHDFDAGIEQLHQLSKK